MARTKTTPERLAYTVEEAAQTCGVSDDTLRRWLASGELLGARLGRRTYVLRDDLVAFLRAHREAS